MGLRRTTEGESGNFLGTPLLKAKHSLKGARLAEEMCFFCED